MLSPGGAQLLIVEALRFGALDRIPEEVGTFRAFCEGPFRRAVRANVAQAGVEQIFERLGHVLWMATSDVSVVDLARTWSQPGPNDRDGDSGVRNVEIGLSGRSGSEPRSPRDSSPRDPRDSSPRDPRDSSPRDPRDSSPRDSSAHDSSPRSAPLGASVPASGATLGRMRAVSKSMAAMPRSNTEIGSPTRDPRSEPFELPAQAGSAVLPTTVLVLSLDTHFISQVRQGLSQHAPVRAIGAANELVGSLVTSGERVVVLIDTALPSIAVPTFAGLIPVLPAGTRVVLWGANKRQLLRLNAIYPDTSGWIVSEGVEDPVTLLLTLP